MSQRRLAILVFSLISITGILIGCIPTKAENLPAVIAQVPTSTVTSSNLIPTATMEEILPTVQYTSTPLPCGEDWCVIQGHFFLQRPIPISGEQRIERTYPYGATQEGKREPHHGVEFDNPIGTSVLAAADGKVYYAGTDHNDVYGWGLDYYGNVIIIEHQLPGYSMPIYSLYGHLSEVLVQTGEEVNANQKLGEVGAEGKAIGAHLHFEVRMGGTTYDDVRNPILWLKPMKNEGIIVGSIRNQNGDLKYYPGLTVKACTGKSAGKTYYPEVYGDPQMGMDTDLQENFVIADLPAGEYEITYSPFGIPARKEITVLAGMITKVSFTIIK